MFSVFGFDFSTLLNAIEFNFKLQRELFWVDFSNVTIVALYYYTKVEF